MTVTTFVHHRIDAAPRHWQALADRLAGGGAQRLAEAGGSLYGIWRSQIGRPRDELQAISVWPKTITAAVAEQALLARDPDVRRVRSEAMVPTLRPTDTTPPTRQGNYAFRWFATPEPHWPEFLDLCAAAWPGFEDAYDSQVVGLWQASGDRTGNGDDEASGAGRFGGVRSLLLTRRPNLAMWERSKLPEGAAEAQVREKLSRRYDLCDWTVVSTATLLTAVDRRDTARWT
ncbi:hypothetical protein [Reyranella sp.]|uniref:hypothetical protein n=1 Tax=Reyranella sp. TaxID=1929291 RepID=UPI0012058470|nr:hypothetical protein [Reyranella sp.]TAJ84235.1 MAG: hypothetical protein EPO50_19375 [Reyranella sp.]